MYFFLNIGTHKMVSYRSPKCKSTQSPSGLHLAQSELGSVCEGRMWTGLPGSSVEIS